MQNNDDSYWPFKLLKNGPNKNEFFTSIHFLFHSRLEKCSSYGETFGVPDAFGVGRRDRFGVVSDFGRFGGRRWVEFRHDFHSRHLRQQLEQRGHRHRKPHQPSLQKSRSGNQRTGGTGPSYFHQPESDLGTGFRKFPAEVKLEFGRRGSKWEAESPGFASRRTGGHVSA